MSRRPRAVIFDWDNTLVDTWPTIHQALNQTLAAMGHPPWTLEESKERVRLSLRDSFPKLFRERWEEARKIYLDSFRAIHLERLTPLPGVVAVLGELQSRGCYQAVVSNKTGAILRREAEALGWNGYFGRLVGATDAAADKPDPAPVRLALSGTGIDPGPDVWFVGDTEVDLQCAVNSGCLPVLLGDAENAEAASREILPALAFADGASLFLHLQTL